MHKCHKAQLMGNLPWSVDHSLFQAMANASHGLHMWSGAAIQLFSVAGQPLSLLDCCVGPVMTIEILRLPPKKAANPLFHRAGQ